MAPPPKKDAFADLFQSANLGSNGSLNDKNLSLLERQRKQQSPAINKSNYSQNSFSNLDILGGSPASNSSVGSVNQSRSSTPNQSNDPFSIFEKPQDKEPIRTSRPSAPVSETMNNTSNTGIGGKNKHEVSLLDDEFTDAFTPEPETAEQLTDSKRGSRSEIGARPRVNNGPKLTEQVSGPRTQDKPSSRTSSRTQVRLSESDSRQSKHESSTDARDTTLAELVDIGFSIEQSNEAIDEVGLDLQTCVNFIMGGGKKKTKKKEATNRPIHNDRDLNNDFGAKINDFSTDFFNKASLFINNSRNTVMKNIEQFQHHSKSDQNDGESSLPAWMKSQHMYKEDAAERKANGGVSENYGSDEENIDHEAINEFIASQKIKDKEKQRARYEHLKGLAKNQISGSTNTSNSQLGRSSPIKHPELPQRPSLQPQSGPSRNEQKPQASSIQQPRAKQASQPVENEVDLLGMNHKSGHNKSQGKSSGGTIEHTFVLTPLNQFQASDYETSKDKATELFRVGDYDTAHVAYTRCLESLPEKHELRLVINSNLALTLIKTGNYKQAKICCDEALQLVTENDLQDYAYLINEKTIKSWYTKLLSRKAESLEMLESFPEALESYMELISKYGVTDKKIMDGRRRVNHIVNPPKAKPRAASPEKAPSKPKTPTQTENNDNLRRIQKQHEDTKKQEEMKFNLHDDIQARIFAWSNGKEDNIRTLLMSLDDIIPAKLGLPFATTKKLTINDLMLPKKVKINYMKVISSIHPDKLTNLELEDKMVCEAVFITLNKAWDIFKEQNGMN
ncbi:unnamed protein product [Debaryomyces tyrocola]|nr:unnamed protein product [Debaryomyces tyrocola]